MEPFLGFVVIGFAAQIVDGALGMAYGVLSTTCLLALGTHPATASASVHAAEVVTTGISGLAHHKLGNVDRKMVWKLALPGVVGSAIGAYVLTEMPLSVLKPLVSAYLVVMGLVILARALGRRGSDEAGESVGVLGFAGGMLDAMGGGGWGPIVTSTLIARGKTPRFTIGTVNLAEFFVTVASSVTFVLTIGLGYWEAILGLLVGGAIAAPVGAHICRRMQPRTLMYLVAGLVIVLSARTIILSFGS